MGTAGTGRAPTVELVGRDLERAAVAEAVAAAAGGSGRLVQVVGNPGVGKTRLVRDLEAAATDAGFECLSAAADHVDADRPFATLAACLDLRTGHPDPARAALADALARAVQPEAPPIFASPHERGGDAGEAVLDVVERLAARRPVALVVDDAQWADTASLRSLRLLVRRLEALPVVVALAFRPAPVPAPLRELAAEAPADHLVEVSLGPLTPNAVAVLVEAVTGAPPGARLAARLDGAGGNPFEVIEALEALRRRGDLVADGGRVDLAAGAAGASAAGAPRLQLLAPPTVDLLRVAAVLGTAFSVAELAAVVGRPAAALLAPLDEALDAGVVETADHSRLRFRHDLLRDALVRDLPEPVRQALHLDAARAAAAGGSPPSRVAHHLVRGAAPGDPETLDWLHRAAAEAVARDPRTAVRLLEHALALAAADGIRRPDLEVDLAEAQMLAGRPAEAEATARAVVAAGGDDDAVRSVLSEALFMQGRFADAVEQLDALAVGPAAASPRRLAAAAYGRLLSYDLDGARRRGEEALAAADAAADDEARSLALTALSYLAMARGEGEAAVELGRRSVEAAERSAGQAGHRFQPALFLAMALDLQDRADDADAAIRLSATVSDRIGVGWDAPLRHGVTAGCHVRAGRWDDAVAEAEAGLRLSEDHGMHLASVLLESHLALVELHRGRLAEAEAAVARAEGMVHRHGSRLGVTWLYWAKALLGRARNDDRRAYAILKGVVEATAAVGIIGRNHLLLPDLVALALKHGEPAVAEAGAEQADTLAGRSRAATTVAAALRCRGLLEDDVGCLVEAAAALDGAGRPFEEAAAREDAAFALAGVGRAPEARPLAEAALAAYESMGARLDAARLRTAMQSRGVRLRRRAAPRPATGWESLTASERRVVDLVAEGLSNPEVAERLFVSRRTVETHLYHVFDKLGVSSRVELAVQAARRFGS